MRRASFAPTKVRRASSALGSLSAEPLTSASPRRLQPPSLRRNLTASMPPKLRRTEAQTQRVRLVIASSVMLTFISFWRAAAIVLNDLGSSAFYAGGIAEEAVGKSAPWFILGVMLFSFAVRAVYVESCSMFTRGGVYRIVKEALGGTFAKLSVSALMFDYILTGPISGVSAGQYVVGLLNELVHLLERHSLFLGLIQHGDGTLPHLPGKRYLRVHRRHRHALFLVAEHQGHRRVER